MSLAETLSNTKRPRQGLPCPFEAILASLDDADREILIEQFALPVGDPRRISNAVLARALTDDGHRIREKSVERHRNRICRCFVTRS